MNQDEIFALVMFFATVGSLVVLKMVLPAWIQHDKHASADHDRLDLAERLLARTRDPIDEHHGQSTPV